MVKNFSPWMWTKKLSSLSRWNGVVEFGDEKHEDVTGVVQDAEGKWYLDIVQVLDREASEACRNSFARDALIDYEHESDEPSGSTRAGGWAEDVATRNDGHYGRIRWSADGLRDVTGGMFRYLSPVFPWRDLEHLGANRYRPKSYTKLALTNSPRLKGIKAVSNSDHKTLDPRVGSTGTAPEQAEREKEKKTMREQMIQALGLPPETTDEQLVAAVGDMKKRLDEINAREQEAQVENDLKTYGDRVQDPKVLKDALAKNRDAILPVLKVLKPAAPAQALNTAKTKTPAEGPTAANRAKEQERAVEDYRVKNKCSRREAWAAMRREKPELFAKED